MTGVSEYEAKRMYRSLYITQPLSQEENKLIAAVAKSKSGSKYSERECRMFGIIRVAELRNQAREAADNKVVDEQQAIDASQAENEAAGTEG